MKLQQNLISENFTKTHNVDFSKEYSIYKIRARKLLQPERIDLAAKLAYIEAKDKGVDLAYAREIYSKHLEAFSEGYFVEPGDKNKTSLSKYFEVFDSLIRSIGECGFDESTSLIPVGKNHIILDGSHRVACAIYFDLEVSVVEFPEVSVCFDYNYFRKRNLSEEILREMTIFYTKYAENDLYCACLWPIIKSEGQKRAKKLIADSSRVLYESDVDLQYTGLRNFMLQIYGHQDWVGTLEDQFVGLPGKVDACFCPGEKTGVVIFKGGDLDDTLALKEKARHLFSLDKHSLHISDTVNETRLMVSLLMNDNSIHALNYGKPDQFKSFFEDVRREKGETDSAYFDYAATISYYGIQNMAVKKATSISINPRRYFTYDGCNFVAIQCVKDYLSNDADKALVKKVSEFIKLTNCSSKNLKRQAEYLHTKLNWTAQKWVLKSKQVAARITMKLGLYDFLHKLHHRS